MKGEESFDKKVDQVLYRNSRATTSTFAGFSFGRLFYQSQPDLSRDQVIDMALTMRLAKKMDAEAYRLAFFLGYTRERKEDTSVNMLTEVTEKELNKLARISSVIAQAQSERPRTPFAKMEHLMDHESPPILCIRRIWKTTNDYGTQWKLLVKVDDETARYIDVDDQNQCIIGFAISNDPHSERDAVFQLLQDEYDQTGEPAHCASFEKLKTKAGKPFYKFYEIDAVCSCGHVIEEDEGEYTDVDDSDPFLPRDFPEDPSTPSPAMTETSRKESTVRFRSTFGMPTPPTE